MNIQHTYHEENPQLFYYCSNFLFLLLSVAFRFILAVVVIVWVKALPQPPYDVKDDAKHGLDFVSCIIAHVRVGVDHGRCERECVCDCKH